MRGGWKGEKKDNEREWDGGGGNDWDGDGEGIKMGEEGYMIGMGAMRQ